MHIKSKCPFLISNPMRTSTLTRILGSILEGFFLKKEKVAGIIPSTGQPQTFLKISGITAFKNNVERLEKLNLFKQQTDDLKNTALYSGFNFQSGPDEITLPMQQADAITSQVYLIHTLLEQLFEALDNTTTDESSSNDSISVKLPESIRSFGELEKFSHDIDIALNQTVTDSEIGGQVEIIGVESGSIWIYVYLGSSAAVALVGRMLWAAAVVHKKKQEGDMLFQQVRSLKIANDYVEGIQKAQLIAVNSLLDAEASHVANESFQNVDNEKPARIKHAINILSDLLAQGTEIRPALYAPEEVSNLFPDPKKLNDVKSRIRQIENQ